MDVVLLTSMMILMMMLTVFLQLGYRPSARAPVEMRVNGCKWMCSAWRLARCKRSQRPLMSSCDEERKFQKGFRANTASL
jgi:hypothetical protein